MRIFFLLFLVLSSLFLTAGIFTVSQVQGQNQNVYSLEIQGLAWDRTTLNILLVTPDNESWWNPMYINSTLRAVGQWNEAIQYFAANYTDYAYLSFVKIEPAISNQTEPGFDIYLNWTQTTLQNTADEIGLASLNSKNNAITECTLNLATHTSHGDALTDGDEQNIALHELGHALSLGHSNYTGDIMYPAYTLLGSARLISTLDVYGVAISFAWMANQVKFYPVREWLQGGQVVLPLNIQFNGLQVSAQNARPQTLQNNPIVQTLILMFEILIHRDILVPVIIFIGVLIIIALIPTKKKKRQVSKAVS